LSVEVQFAFGNPFWERRDLLMPNLGPLELIIILVIVLLVFGVGRVSKIGGEIGTAVREFREGLQGSENTLSEKQEKGEARSDGSV
jgi:sec-independent protein translocase protein TatA